MPRSRSRSPKRPADRRRSRSRERKHRHRRSRSPVARFRSRSPVAPRRRSRSHSPRRRSPSPRRKDVPKAAQPEKAVVLEMPKIDEAQLEGMSEEDREMMALMGFAGFDSTKGKKVEGNDIYTASIVRKRRYRQYMNRRGGFNRPLDFIA